MPREGAPVSEVLARCVLILLFAAAAQCVENRKGPTDCTHPVSLRISEEKSGVIMMAPDPSVTLDFLSSSNPDIIYQSATKQLVATKPLVLEKGAGDAEVKFNCTKDGKSKDNFFVYVKILEINNVMPLWKVGSAFSNVSTVSVKENTLGKLIPSTMPTIVCDGRDTSSVDKLSMEIISGPYSDHFKIVGSGNHLDVNVEKKLDYEKVKNLVLTIRCTDRNESGTVIGAVDFLLTVNVQNVEEKGSYSFKHPKYFASLSLDDVVAGTDLKLSPEAISATNPGADVPVYPVYTISSIFPLPDPKLFEMNNQTGVLSITGNYSKPVQFNIDVRVSVLSDPKGTAGSATVEVKFTPSPKIPLLFVPSSLRPIRISENHRIGSPLRKMEVKYPDHVPYQPKDVQFSVTMLDNTFYFNGTSNLILRRSLDFEKNDKKLTVEVEARDNVTAPIRANITVTVVDENDNPPAFVKDEYKFVVSKPNKSAPIGQVTASDADANSKLTYSISGASSSIFKIDSATGNIYFVGDIGKLNKTAYSFAARASDGHFNGAAIVKVEIKGGGVGVATANASTIAVAALGATIFLIIVISAIGFCLFNRRQQSYNAAAQREKRIGSRLPGDSIYSETGVTTLQENPVYGNDLDDGGIDMGMFKGDRDVSEMDLYDSGDAVGPTIFGGSIHTVMTTSTSSFHPPGQHPSHLSNGNSIRLPNNMELVSADVVGATEWRLARKPNAVYSRPIDEVTPEPQDELTIYY